MVPDPGNGHWTDYWQQGNLTSLPHGFAGNYDGEFLQFWEEQFAGLARGACVLDVCSGNGSIALLARDFSVRHQLDLQVKATDAAHIDAERVAHSHPGLAQHIEAIEFLPGIPLEVLAIPSASCDLATSQFGIEYSDWAVSAANIYRMLKPGGGFAMVCHSADSTILREMASQQADYERICGIALFNEALPDRGNASATLAQQLEQGLQELYELFQRNRSSQILSAAGGRLEDIRKLALQDPGRGLREFIRLRDGIRVSRGIAEDLLAVNRALQASPDWHQAFVEAGLERVDSGEIHYRTGDTAGASYRFVKPRG